MHGSLRLLQFRRFLPLFVTQFLGAFNDNLFKQATILLAVYTVYHNPKLELSFTGIAYAAYVLPFFLFSALGGQLADAMDKARIIRIVKAIEIGIMALGALGLWVATIGFALLGVHLLVIVLFLMGMHSSFFGPTKYAILPQHLEKDEVLGGTSMVEAGTNVAILVGIIVGGLVADAPLRTGALVLVTALLGYAISRYVPPAPPAAGAPPAKMDWHIIRASVDLVNRVMHVPKLYYAIMAVSFFVVEASIIGVVFAPVVKNVLGADPRVATLMLVIFTIGIAVGAIAVNALLRGQVSAQYCVPSAFGMAFFLMLMFWTLNTWDTPDAADIGQLEWRDFLGDPNALILLSELMGVAICGGIFVVPLYAILTTAVDKSQAARVIAANNIITSAAGVFGALLAAGVSYFKIISIPQTFILTAVITLGSIWVAHRLIQSCEGQASIQD